MKSLFAFLLTLLVFPLAAQDAEAHVEAPALAYRAEAKTVELKRFAASRERTILGDLDLTGLWGGPTYNYSMTGDDWAFVRGGFGGLEFGDEFFLGYGGWRSREPFNVDDNPTDDTEYDFRQGGFILAYSPGRDRSVHPRFSTIIGPGSIDIEDDEPGRDRMLVGQAMVGVELNLFQVLRLGIDGGYRFANGVDYEAGNGRTISDRDVSGAVLQIEARFGFSW